MTEKDKIEAIALDLLALRGAVERMSADLADLIRQIEAALQQVKSQELSTGDSLR